MLCLKRKQFAVLDFCIHGFATAQLNTLNNTVPILGQFAARNQFADARREAVIAVYLERRMSAEQIWISAAAFFKSKAGVGINILPRRQSFQARLQPVPPVPLTSRDLSAAALSCSLAG